MPEFRQDPVTQNWVIIATERAKRPSDYASTEDKGRETKATVKDTCPFCPGNEEQTPPEVFALRSPDTKADSPGWQVRVVPNKFAALLPEENGEEQKTELYRCLPGKGVHEVIIEIPEHEASFPDYPPQQAIKVLQAWRQRYLQHSQKGLKYIQIFKNQGQIAGASLEHPHSQLLATPFIPPAVSQELKRVQEYLEKEESCLFCDLLEEEMQKGARVVAFNKKFLAFCPYASRFPFETWIFPRQHQSHFGEIEDENLEDLAAIMQDVLGRLQRALQDPPFNLILRSAPVNGETQEINGYHWHFQLLPRLTIVAGFEYGTGIYINPTPPELAAQFLTQANKEDENDGET